MSFVGKILVVVQVVLSICFMAFAGAVSATHQTWQQRYAQEQKNVERQAAEIAALQQQIQKVQDDARVEIAQKEAEAAELRVKNLEVVGNLDALTVKYNALSESEKSKGELAAIAQEDAKARRAEALTLQELNKSLAAAKDAEFRAKTQLEDEVFELKVERERLKSENIALLRTNKKLTEVLVANNLPTEIDDYEKRTNPPPANLRGVVMRAQKAKSGNIELVEISLGSDDGLTKGHELHVYRTGTDTRYLGKIQIVYTEPDKAVGTVVTAAKNGIIQEGDNVTTKL